MHSFVTIVGFVQDNLTGTNYNAESNLDLQYGMALVTAAQDVTLYQVGDIVESLLSLCCYQRPNHADTSFCHRRILQQLSRCS
jgi:hypothetical protein